MKRILPLLILAFLSVEALADRPSAADRACQEKRDSQMPSASDLRRLSSFLESEGGKVDLPSTVIVKDDLDGDGSSEFVVPIILAEKEQSHGKHGLAVVRNLNSRPSLVTFFPENNDPGIRNRREIVTCDFDDDGTQDIVERRFYDIGGGEAEHFCLILKYHRRSLVPVYAHMSYDDCALVDLDNDNVTELIESRNEFQIPALPYWPVIYRWRNGAWQDAQREFPDFYRSRLPKYMRALEHAYQAQKEYKEKTGEINELDQEIIGAMEVYIARIKSFLEGYNDS